MFDMVKTPHVLNADQFAYFEPTPVEKFDDSTLEGCLNNASKIETLYDKDNLYLCEQCTEDKYGKSKISKCFEFHL